MVVDNRSLKEINEDINSRMLLLGRVVIMRRTTIIFFFFMLIMSIYNIIKWFINDLKMDARCGLAILWLLLAVVALLLYNALQGFSLSLKQEIFNDKKILSKL
jgi:membrane protein YdbS with pleckstrin-like domain